MNREELKEKYKELVKVYGRECMVEQTELNYVSQSARERLPEYNEDDDKLYLYKGNYLVKGYNIKFLKELPEDMEIHAREEMRRHKEYILRQKYQGRHGDNSIER